MTRRRLRYDAWQRHRSDGFGLGVAVWTDPLGGSWTDPEAPARSIEVTVGPFVFQRLGFPA